MANPPTVPPDLESAPATALDGSWTSPAVVAHVVPFAAWILLMLVLDRVGDDGAWKYAVRTAVTAVLLVLFRPWRWYPRLTVGHLWLAMGTGVVVLAVWVVPILGIADGMPMVQELYLRFAVLPLGRLPTMPTHSIYSPDACGWPLALVRLAGSAFVIAAAEEFFWRGFVYRRLQQTAFLRAPLNQFDPEAFWFCAILFGLEHREVVAGVIAGAAYALLLIRTKDMWAAIAAHACTNLLLGLYVLRYDAYGFW